MEKFFNHVYSFIRSFINQFIHSFLHSFIHFSIHSVISSFIHSFIHSFISLFTHSFISLFIHSFIHFFIHSFIHLIIQDTIMDLFSIDQNATSPNQNFHPHSNILQLIHSIKPYKFLKNKVKILKIILLFFISRYCFDLSIILFITLIIVK